MLAVQRNQRVACALVGAVRCALVACKLRACGKVEAGVVSTLLHALRFVAYALRFALRCVAYTALCCVHCGWEVL